MLVNGNAFRIPMRDGFVHCVITSPPYFGKRIYDGLAPIVFGGDLSCEHEWGELPIEHKRGKVGDHSTLGGGPMAKGVGRVQEIQQGVTCVKCGAWRGFYGSEALHDCLAWARGEKPCSKCYVCHTRMVGAEVWRVLRDDGTWWLNIGDSFNGSMKGYAPNGPGYGGPKQLTNVGSIGLPPTDNLPGLKPKDLIGIPERVRLALQADGWYWRTVAPWIKKNSLPESTEDRPSYAHEDIILLTKIRKYFYDFVAIRKSQAVSTPARLARGMSGQTKNVDDVPGQAAHSIFQPRPNLSKTFARPDGKNTVNVTPGQACASHRDSRDDVVPDGRNRRTTDWFWESLDENIADIEDYLAHLRHVRDKGGMLLGADGDPLALLVNPVGYKGAHYATFSERLVEPMILSSTSAVGVCPECDKQWERVTERNAMQVNRTNRGELAGNRTYCSGTMTQPPSMNTIGWRPACDCIKQRAPNFGMRVGELLELADDIAQELAPVPAIVLDPFVGSGTTVAVAKRLGRRGIGIDASMQYLSENALPRAERRNTKKAIETLPLFALDVV